MLRCNKGLTTDSVQSKTLKMHIASFIFSLMSCVVTEQTYLFDKFGQGITDITIYIIPSNTTEIMFNSNSLTHTRW